MGFLAEAIAQHGYSILFAVVFMEAIGLPVPAALGLLIAGGSAAQGILEPRSCVPIAFSAMLLGDSMMYLLGKYTGWWLLGMLCRISLNPEACVLQSADSFYKRGRVVLAIAKFLPGINTMAPSLSGSMGMPVLQFYALDSVAAALYTGVWFGGGYVFSDVLDKVTRGYSAFGDAVGWAIGAGAVLWFANRIRIWRGSKKERPVNMVKPADVAAPSPDTIFLDARSHGYYDKGTQRIFGSKRFEPNALSELAAGLPKDKKIVLYCTCYREATSARVARALEDVGLNVSVLEGGFRAWVKAGLPVETVPEDEVVMLPKFVR